MTEFVIFRTNIKNLNYNFMPPGDNFEIEIETKTTSKILRNNNDPQKILIEIIIDMKAKNSILAFEMTTETPIDLHSKMSDAEINNKCLPLVFTAVNEQLKAITGCIQSPRLELPPVQILIEQLLFK